MNNLQTDYIYVATCIECLFKDEGVVTDSGDYIYS